MRKLVPERLNHLLYATQVIVVEIGLQPSYLTSYSGKLSSSVLYSTQQFLGMSATGLVHFFLLLFLQLGGEWGPGLGPLIILDVSLPVCIMGNKHYPSVSALGAEEAVRVRNSKNNFQVKVSGRDCDDWFIFRKISSMAPPLATLPKTAALLPHYHASFFFTAFTAIYYMFIFVCLWPVWILPPKCDSHESRDLVCFLHSWIANRWSCAWHR